MLCLGYEGGWGSGGRERQARLSTWCFEHAEQLAAPIASRTQAAVSHVKRDLGKKKLSFTLAQYVAVKLLNQLK